MSRVFENADLRKIIMVGDRVLIKPEEMGDKTRSGLYLPPGVKEKEKIQTGYVMKVGPGYAIPALPDTDEPWMNSTEEVKYVPIQPREGDMAVYLQKSGYDLEFNKERYVIVPVSAILLLFREEDL